MSFFRNLRSSITRGRSSSRDTTPVCNSRQSSIRTCGRSSSRDTTPVCNSRHSSVRSSLNSGSSKRADSIESRDDSMLNRSDTFILDNPAITPSHSNCSTLEKKSKKSKVLEKFSTFTRRKKNSANDAGAFEHHPSDNATNTYYKWQAEEGGNSLDYESQNDPFNFLYEQQSSLKSMHNSRDPIKSKNSPPSKSFDSSTYRKSKMPTDLKKQLKLLKNHDLNSEENGPNIEEKIQLEEDEQQDETTETSDLKADKYKTVTLNSFRRSFREKFLQQQKEAGYNPAWFVAVETPEVPKQRNDKDHRDTSHENRRDLLIFKNENYRPNSKSPIRDLSNRRELRTSTRSPVKRNETFKVERLSRLDQQAYKSKPEENTASIHIEFKNSITPHVPGRMVPVGVAKPMPAQLTYSNYYQKTEPTAKNTDYSKKNSAGITTTRLNNNSPVRSPWLQSEPPARSVSSNANRSGRYQTLVQIKSDKSQQASPTTERTSRLATRIRLEPSKPDKKANISAQSHSQSPSFGKRYYSSQVLSHSGGKAQPLKQTYFGETPQTAKISQIPSHLSSSTTGLRTRPTAAPHYAGYRYQTPSIFASTSSLTPATATATAALPTRTTPAHSVSNIHSSANSNHVSYFKHHQQPQHQQQQQTRFIATGQRRPRSPIKIPWR